MNNKMMSKYNEFLDFSLCKYDNQDLTKRDVMNVFSTFSDFRPQSDVFVFNDGFKKKLLQLEGTVPVHYRGVQYNIPVSVWLMRKHPLTPPIVYVQATSKMQIKSGKNVDKNGKIELPYLREWKYPQSDLLGLIQIMAKAFGEEPPVYLSVQNVTSHDKRSGSYGGTGATAGTEKMVDECRKDNRPESDAKCGTCGSTESKVVHAEGYCADCKEFFCKKCLRYHRRLTATKNHKIYL